jgi:superfamily II DNA or RNA helicase
LKDDSKLGKYIKKINNMSTKFFNNNDGRSLFDKLKGIAEKMSSFDRFLAVAGYFRSSGYFKLREELHDVKEIKILVGINIDDIFRRHNKAMLMLGPEIDAQTKKEYYTEFKEDIQNAKYSPDIERGITQMCEDLISGKLEIKIHPTKNLHAKFYLCLPENHDPDTDGWVIMGSSNISESGLGITQAPRYELNVAMRDFDDVDYCHEEFKKLWEEAIPLTIADIDQYKAKTYLGYQPTPYEVYIKVLIDTFGDQVEDDFNIQLPDGVMDLKYQKDAVIQGYQMLMQHNGLFLADVVGLGKTMIATMIAKRFVEANGKRTSILVIYPPALERNWKDTFKLFGIRNKAQFITNGSLLKVLNGENQYKDKEEFDLVIVDEAHGFRTDTSGKYDELQKICKSVCSNPGLLASTQKKVMLLSATPLNNRPNDLLNQLLLFQNSQNCTIDGVPNLKAFFSPLIQEYNKLMRERGERDVTDAVDHIYKKIREEVIDKVTIRRTRHNIMDDDDYKTDLALQHIRFPNILPPEELEYRLGAETNDRFYNTLVTLTNADGCEEHLEYARYRAIEFLEKEYQERYRNAEQVSTILAGIYRVHMVKRLESSFYAFRRSLHTLLRITNDMIKMWESDKVIIAPDLNIKDMQAKGMELDAIIEYAGEKGYKKDDIVYPAEAFKPEFIELLRNDKVALEHLCENWEMEKDDPKFDKFIEKLNGELKDPLSNPTGKVIIFSESVDTLTYLYSRLNDELGMGDVLMVSASNRDRLDETIRANFDANYDKEKQKDIYNILLTSDVLAEGINLHRSNIIVNYDSPWNATRLMQRIGRVNRIGSVAENIYNYTFYPSKQGDKEIQLYKNALIKLQGFHSAFGEDAQIYSHEEVVKQFEMFDSNIKDSVDKKIQLLREVRELYNTDRNLYHKIKKLPLKSRVIRQIGKHIEDSIVFISSKFKTEFYHIHDEKANPIDFLAAVNYLKAKKDEQPVPFTGNETFHYKHVNQALNEYKNTFTEVNDNIEHPKRPDLDRTSLQALKFLREVMQVNNDMELNTTCNTLKKYIEDGVYAKLPRRIRDLSNEYKHDRQTIKLELYQLQTKLSDFAVEYQTQTSTEQLQQQALEEPEIVISETFI